MRSLIMTVCIIFTLTLAGCGGGGGGSAAPSGPPVTPPPAGVITFANGAKFNTNYDSSTGRRFCQNVDLATWDLSTSGGYTLRGYGARGGFNMTFNFACDTTTTEASVYVVKMTMTFTGGGMTPVVETRYLAADIDGNIRLMGVQGTGSDDFLTATVSDSPVVFLPNLTASGTSWIGGFSGTDAMDVIGEGVPAPSGHASDSIHFRQNAPGGTVTDWWYVKGYGFVMTDRGTAGGFDRQGPDPFAAG